MQDAYDNDSTYFVPKPPILASPQLSIIIGTTLEILQIWQAQYKALTAILIIDVTPLEN
jgi:hypothetical protein